jgi:hypothetical protein
MILKKNSKSVYTISKTGENRKLYCTCGYEGEALNDCCPECDKEIEVNLLGTPCAKFHHLESTESDDNLSIRLNIYFYKRSVRRKEPSDASFSFSKKLYLIQLDKNTGKVTLSKGTDKIYLKELWGDSLQQKWIEDMSGIKRLKLLIASLLFKARNILDIEPAYFNGENFSKIFLFIKHPNLQYLGSHRIQCPDNRYLTSIDSATGKIDLFHKLIGHKSKKLIERCSNPYAFNLLLVWGKLVEHPENLLNLLDELYFQDLGRADLFEFGNNRHALTRGIFLLKKLHAGQDEKIWIHRLIKAVRNGYNVTPSMLNAYVVDIEEMYSYILSKAPDYAPIFDGDIRHLHDTLSSDQRKITNPNLTIPYQEKERKLEKRIDQKSEFILAPDTHYLIEVGSKMNICVGSYGRRVMQKECHIIVLKEMDEPVVCIEIRGKELIQAKMKYNQRPTGGYKEVVINWSKENRIEYRQCIDIA